MSHQTGKDRGRIQNFLVRYPPPEPHHPIQGFLASGAYVASASSYQYSSYATTLRRSILRLSTILVCVRCTPSIWPIWSSKVSSRSWLGQRRNTR